MNFSDAEASTQLFQLKKNIGGGSVGESRTLESRAIKTELKLVKKYDGSPTAMD
jgi:hypothetical protein